MSAATIRALAKLTPVELALAVDAYRARFGDDEHLEVFCGNLDCATRQPGTLRTFTLDRAHLVDGRVWVCETCRSSDEAAAWPAADPCPCGMAYDHHHSVEPGPATGAASRNMGRDFQGSEASPGIASPAELAEPAPAVMAGVSVGLCGHPMPTDARTDARYCSSACRQAAYRVRREGATR